MSKIIEGDTREPAAGFLTYGPDIDVPNPRVPFGPNTFNELLWPVTIERTAEKTRIGFSYVAPPRAEL